MSTPPRSSPRAATARSASARAGSDGSTGLRTAPRATFVRHSPGRAQRSTAPMTRPPRNDNAEVASGGFDESLHEQAVATKPAPARNVVEPCLAARPNSDTGAYGAD